MITIIHTGWLEKRFSKEYKLPAMSFEQVFSTLNTVFDGYEDALKTMYAHRVSLQAVLNGKVVYLAPDYLLQDGDVLHLIPIPCADGFWSKVWKKTKNFIKNIFKDPVEAAKKAWANADKRGMDQNYKENDFDDEFEDDEAYLDSSYFNDSPQGKAIPLVYGRTLVDKPFALSKQSRCAFVPKTNEELNQALSDFMLAGSKHFHENKTSSHTLGISNLSIEEIERRARNAQQKSREESNLLRTKRHNQLVRCYRAETKLDDYRLISNEKVQANNLSDLDSFSVDFKRGDWTPESWRSDKDSKYYIRNYSYKTLFYLDWYDKDTLCSYYSAEQYKDHYFLYKGHSSSKEIRNYIWDLIINQKDLTNPQYWKAIRNFILEQTSYRDQPVDIDSFSSDYDPVDNDHSVQQIGWNWRDQTVEQILNNIAQSRYTKAYARHAIYTKELPFVGNAYIAIQGSTNTNKEVFEKITDYRKLLKEISTNENTFITGTSNHFNWFSNRN